MSTSLVVWLVSRQGDTELRIPGTHTSIKQSAVAAVQSRVRSSDPRAIHGSSSGSVEKNSSVKLAPSRPPPPGRGGVLHGPGLVVHRDRHGALEDPHTADDTLEAEHRDCGELSGLPRMAQPRRTSPHSSFPSLLCSGFQPGAALVPPSASLPEDHYRPVNAARS